MNSRIKKDIHKLFEFWCEVKQSYAGGTDAMITECFPESYNDTEVISKLPEFTFPCEFEKMSVQTYSFIITSDDSKFRFGFCRHDPKTQTACVLLTFLPWHDTFIKLLTMLSELHRSQYSEFKSFLLEVYNKDVPEPGTSLKLFYNAGHNRPSQFELPSIPENNNLNLYYNFVDPKNMIGIFSAMLSERRIIFTSRRLDRLSSCIQAAAGFLYPMVWQHIFIPILPMKMKEILCAPMPYLIGVPEAVLRQVTTEELGEVVVLNCDSNEFKNPFDDMSRMPPELVSQMKKNLGNTHELIGDQISRIFLRVLVQLIGGYRDAAKYSQSRKITWDRDIFIESRPQYLRDFLKNMLELQIFQQFIDERLDILNSGQGISDEFEMETLRFTDKSSKSRKNYRDFLRNVKDKTNPAVKSAVKSVKEGGRGVKTVYKDLKSRLQDITPPKTAQFHKSISSADLTQCHQSAPNSPVCSKREMQDNSPTLQFFLAPKVSSSISQIKSTPGDSEIQKLTYSHELILDNLNIPTNQSPAISPCNSISLSDMNISTELEDHPLFKSINSEKKKPVTANAIYGVTFSPNDESVKLTEQTIHKPLNIQAPLIPPKSKTVNFLIADEITSTKDIQRSHMRSRNKTLDNVINPKNSSAPLLHNNARELLNYETPMRDNLIQLEENLKRYDISDLDPLNLNAKPIPNLAQALELSSASKADINNHLNPHLITCHRTEVCRNLVRTEDFENELMRQYGLDKFSYTNSNALEKPDQMSRWTTFDS